YLNKRDANQGTCTNACRWKYDATPATENATGDIVREVQPTLGLGAPTEQVFLLQESNRPGIEMPAFEDEHGTYIMNAKDLRAIQHVERLAGMGVHSLKIEGRTKSHFYCARAVQSYRQAIDDAVAGRPFDRALMGNLESLAQRGYTEGFLRRHVHDEYQNYQRGNSVSERQQFVGELTGVRVEGLAEVKVKNRFAVGDHLELMTPRGNYHFDLHRLCNRQQQAIDVAPGDGHVVYLPIPEQVALDYALLMRDLRADEVAS
ncbi:U32 family peptidase C-terminal domain-containing protein, partial [Pseudomonas putida]